MVKVGDIYKTASQQLLNVARVEELGLWLTSLKIANVQVQQLRDRQKIVLELTNGKESYNLPLNRTNAIILAESFGEDTDAWIGKEIILQKVKRAFQGRLVDAIEVKSVETTPKAPKAKK
ncbi:MAG: hypothetical protein ABIK73_08645 [candidate division WOR-3 bacterium]